jgi:hypothetical protein
MDNWFQENYEGLKKLCRNITKEIDVDELLHFCVEQALKNKNFIAIEKPQEKFYFFSRIVKNNYSSKKSPYHKQYRKMTFMELAPNIEVKDIEYTEDGIDMDWVNNELEEMKKGEDWYFARLFDLYIQEDCNLTKLSKRTTIPLNSVARDIKKVRQFLINKRNKKLYGM